METENIMQVTAVMEAETESLKYTFGNQKMLCIVLRRHKILYIFSVILLVWGFIHSFIHTEYNNKSILEQFSIRNRTERFSCLFGLRDKTLPCHSCFAVSVLLAVSWSCSVWWVFRYMAHHIKYASEISAS